MGDSESPFPESHRNRRVELMRLVKCIFTLGLVLAFLAQASWADSPVAMEPYSQATFDKAQSEGKVILLDFYASWCPTCRKQHAILPGILAEKEFAGIVPLQIDFDNSDDLQKALKVGQQSTFVLFKGKTEVARSTGVTDGAKIREFIQRAYK